MKDNRRREEYGAFITKWGVHIADSNYTQVPNLLIRGLSELKLTTAEYSVLLIILSNAPDWYIATSYFSDKLDMSKSTIKNIYRSLENKGYIQRIQHTGSANSFDYSGLKHALKLLALDKHPIQKSDTPSHPGPDIAHGSEQYLDTPQSNDNLPPGQPSDTNKELKNKDNKVSGIDKFKQERKDRGI